MGPFLKSYVERHQHRPLASICIYVFIHVYIIYTQIGMIIQYFLLCYFYYIYFVVILAILFLFQRVWSRENILESPWGSASLTSVLSRSSAVCDTRVPVMRLSLDWRMALEEHPVNFTLAAF